MRKLLRLFSVSIAVMMTISSSVAYADTTITTTQSPPRLESSPLVISGYLIKGNVPGYIELYNNSNSVQNIKNWQLEITWQAAAAKESLSLSPLAVSLTDRDQYLAAKSYVVISFDQRVPTASIQITTGLMSDPQIYVSQIAVQNSTFKPYVKSFTSIQSQRMYLNETSTGYTTTGSYAVDTRDGLYDNGLYEIGVSAPSEFALSPVEIMANPRNCSPLDAAIDCREYVKFYNSTDSEVSFENTRLRIGALGSASVTLPLSGVIAPGEYAVFDHAADGGPLPITNSGGYVWLEDTLGIITYEKTVTEFADASSAAHKGQSWALIDSTWQWAQPNPSGDNMPLPPPVAAKPVTTTLTPCNDGQYRSPETNRCRATAVTTSSLVPCASDEYRSPDTNRCRKIVTTASSLQSCDAGQYRNPETNRCKSIAAASSSLTQCAENQERNPETNRCRKVQGSSMPSANYPVIASNDRSQSEIGWLAFGFVGLLAIGYAIWEWRSEITTVLIRLKHQLTRHS